MRSGIIRQFSPFAVFAQIWRSFRGKKYKKTGIFADAGFYRVLLNLYFYALIAQNFADRFVEHKRSHLVGRGRGFVDDDKETPSKEVQKPCRRINVERGAADNQHIRRMDGADRFVEHFFVKLLAVQNDVRLDDSAAVAAGNAGRVENGLERVEFAALYAVVPIDASVQFEHVFASGSLMQVVDVLGDDRFQFALAFQLRERVMRFVGLYVRVEHLVAVEFVKLLGMFEEKLVTEHQLGRIVVFLVVKSVRTAEIGDAALGGYARASEEYDSIALVNQFF